MNQITELRRETERAICEKIFIHLSHDVIELERCWGTLILLKHYVITHVDKVKSEIFKEMFKFKPMD